MASQTRRRRAEGSSLPIIHFYQAFVKTASARHATTSNNDGWSPAIELSITKSSIDLRSRTTSSDAMVTNNKLVGMSPDTQMTETRSGLSAPVSPLTPFTLKHVAETSQEFGASKTATRVESMGSANKKLTIYERSQLRLKEREKKIQNIRDELMKDCTFRPNTATPNALKTSKAKEGTSSRRSPQRSTDKSSTTTPTIATTPTRTTSSTRQYWQEYQRNHQQQLEASAASSRDGSKSSLANKSLRFEELYEEGLRKARQRPATEKAEQELRNRRWEELQLKECTFKPKLYWGTRVQTKRRKPLVPGTQALVLSASTSSRPGQTAASTLSPHRSPSPRRRLLFETPPEAKKDDTAPINSQTDPFPDIELSPIPTDEDDMNNPSCTSLSLLRRHHDIMRQRSGNIDEEISSPIPPVPLEITTTGVAPLPLEIITTSVSPASRAIPLSSRPWSTVLYNSTREQSLVSPLQTRRTLGIEIDEYHEKTSLAPRIIFSSTTFGGDCSVAAQTERTEYGSI